MVGLRQRASINSRLQPETLRRRACSPKNQNDLVHHLELEIIFDRGTSFRYLYTELFASNTVFHGLIVGPSDREEHPENLSRGRSSLGRWNFAGVFEPDIAHIVSSIFSSSPLSLIHRDSPPDMPFLSPGFRGWPQDAGRNRSSLFGLRGESGRNTSWPFDFGNAFRTF